MPNINKVVYGNTTLLDLTDSTLNSADSLASGVTAYDRSGTKLTGTLVVDSTYSITKNLTAVTSSADDTKVIAGNSFFTELVPSTGYVISEITVTMGGVDITDQVFKPGTGAKTITANGTYAASNDNMSGYSAVVVNVPSSGSTLGTKTVTQNGTYYASNDNLDGYSQVSVNVQGGVTPTGTKNISITSNGTTTEDVTNYASASITANVPNSYTSSDEGKVVSNGALVSQTSSSVTQNGTVDTTLISSLLVNVAGSGTTAATGEYTLSSDLSLSATPTALANFQLSFVPDFFIMAMTNASWKAKSAPSGGLYEIIMIKKAYTPPFRQSNSVSTDSFTGDYYKILATATTTTTDSATTNGYVMNGVSFVSNTYQQRFYFGNDGKLYVGRYSTASTKMYAGTYRYFAVKV